MSTTRLTFLYPHLFRSVRISEAATQRIRARPLAPQQPCMRTRKFATSGRREQRFVKRHGKAVEPVMHEAEGVESGKASAVEEEGSDSGKGNELKTKPQEIDKEEEGKDTQKTEPTTTEEGPSSSAPLSEETQAAARLPGDLEGEGGAEEREPGAQQEPTPLQQAATNTCDMVPPIETVLQMPPPESAEDQNASKAPHLQTPPYVHHFDTYTLVREVENGGFTEEQSITAMKAVRGLLALNLDVAKAGLVSKSDVENETYLFRAACSELKTEIQNTRRVHDETMRRERTLLQYEVDILNQKLTQELLGLKDELKGMFDDRKMSVRQEQRAMDSAIQEINYKITVALNSDSKSEVEGLRWVLTRRSVMGILFMAFMVLTSLRYASYKSHEDEVKKKKEEARTEMHIGELPAQGAAEILAAN